MKRNASKDSVYLLAGIDNVRFKQKVLPDDIIKIKSKVITSENNKKNEEIRLNVIIDLTLIGSFSYQFKIN